MRLFLSWPDLKLPDLKGVLLSLCFLTLSTPGCSSSGEEAPGGAESATGGSSDGAGGSGDGDPTGTGGEVEMDEPGSSGGTISTGGTSGGSTASPGCGKVPSSALGEWVMKTPLLVDGAERTWWLRFPDNYDPERLYPVVFLFHGCGDETDNVPLEDYAGSDALLVRGLAAGTDGCWNTTTEVEGKFFEAMREAVLEMACVHASRVFAVGYDSGAELISRLSCYQAYLIDAVATVAGDNALFEGPSCNGPVAAMVIHDDTDMERDISGSEGFRNRLIDQNFCVADGIPEPVEPQPCVQYSGCGSPVIWCATTGQGHDRQDDFAAPAIWDFLSSR